MKKINFINNTGISHLENPVDNKSFNADCPDFSKFSEATQLSVINDKIKYYHPSIKFNIENDIEAITITAYKA